MSINDEGATIRDSAKMADSMNIFFCNIGESLSKDFPTGSNPVLDGAYEILNQDAPFHFSPLTCEKLVATMGNFQSCYGFGIDEISSYFLKIGRQAYLCTPRSESSF